MSAGPSRRAVLLLAWPIVLAQVATALTGVVDTAVMGRLGHQDELGAVAVASVTVSFLYWGFGFLRMSTTALTAQALGAGRAAEARAVLMRALLLGAGFGLCLLLLFPALRWLALLVFQASEGVELGASAYLGARIWGAPAALMGYAVTGWLLGTGRTRALLGFQVVLNVSNALLDVLFVAGWGWGPAGLGVGTAIAEWLALGLGLWLVRDGLGAVPGMLERSALGAMFRANRDIMVRTLALLFGFAWFVNAGALVGPANLAGNQVLLQFIAVAAFVLDAFAFVAEKEVGESVGAGDAGRFWRAIRTTSELALGFGLVFSLVYFTLGGWIVQVWVADPEARAAALRVLPFCAAVPLIGVPAYQLDGVFLGATEGAALRNAALVATAVYVGCDVVLRPLYGNEGVWAAFLVMYVLRACTLGWHLPALARRVAGAELAAKG